MSQVKSGDKGMKILYVSSDKFPPFRVDVAVLFGEKMVARGNQVDWVLQSEDQKKTSEVVDWWGGRVWVGASTDKMSRMGKIKKQLQALRNDLRVLGLAKKNRYDIIQVKDKFAAALIGLVAARIGKAKFIYWLSFPIAEAYLLRFKEGTAKHPVVNYLRGHISKWLLYKLIMPCADLVVLQSEQMKKDVISEGVSEGKLTAVPMGVKIEDMPYSGGVDATRPFPMVVYLGTLVRVRRMDFLIRAFAVTKMRVPDAVLYLVGGGEDDTDIEVLKAEVSRLGLDDAVIFTGFMPMKDAWDFVRKADVCVSPFYPTPILNSTSPTKLVEYMAMGKPVVANDHPEQSLVIRESGAGICVPYDEERFGEAIANLLEDRAAAIRMGVDGRKYVEKNRSYEVIADRLQEKYLRVAGKT